MERRGFGHIEMIFSFIIFVSAVFIIFYFFSPAKSPDLKDTLMKQTLKAIESNASVELLKYSVKINSTNLQQGDVVPIEIDGVNAGSHVRVQNYSGYRLDASRNNNIINVGWNGQDFFYVLFSEDFDDSPAPTGSANAVPYALGSVNSENIISEKRLITLNNSYYGSYSSLKNDLGIPASVDFSFRFSFFDGSGVFAKKNVPAGQETFSLPEKKDIIKEDGSIDEGELAVSVW